MHQMEFEMVTLRLHDRTMWTIYQSETFAKFNGSWINHCVTPNTHCHCQLQWEFSRKLPSWSQDLWFSRICHSNGLCQMEHRCIANDSICMDEWGTRLWSLCHHEFNQWDQCPNSFSSNACDSTPRILVQFNGECLIISNSLGPCLMTKLLTLLWLKS